MPIPDERLPIDDSEDSMESANTDMVDEEEELEFETADVDSADDDLLDGNGLDDPDKAGFGFGDPSD